MLSIFVRRVWDIPTLHFANWTYVLACASNRMFIEVESSVGSLVAALRPYRPRPDGYKLGDFISLQQKSRLPALRFGVD